MPVACRQPPLTLLLLFCIASVIPARAQDAQWPIHSAERPPIVQGFEEFGDVAKGKYSTGLDLGVPAGTAVFPVADGEVVLIQLLSAESDHGFGRTVVMRHSENGQPTFYSQYSHLSEIDAALIEACKPRRPVNDVTLTCAPGVTRGARERIGNSGGSGFGIEDKWPQHLHLEIKSFGTLCGTDAAGPVCGYSTAKPSTIGYVDPIERMVWTRPFPAPVPVVVTANGVTVRAAPDAGPGGRPITTLSRTDGTVPLRGLAWSSGDAPCDEGWIQVSRVDAPNCATASGALACFPDTLDPEPKPPDTSLGLLPTAWICANYLSPAKASTAREAVTHAVLFAGGSVAVKRAGAQGLTVELADRDGLFTVYEAARLGADAVSDLWNLIFLDVLYADPAYKAFAETHRDLVAALLARYGAGCAGTQTPKAQADCAVTRLARSRQIRMGGVDGRLAASRAG